MKIINSDLFPLLDDEEQNKAFSHINKNIIIETFRMIAHELATSTFKRKRIFLKHVSPRNKKIEYLKDPLKFLSIEFTMLERRINALERCSNYNCDYKFMNEISEILFFLSGYINASSVQISKIDSSFNKYLNFKINDVRIGFQWNNCAITKILRDNKALLSKSEKDIPDRLRVYDFYKKRRRIRKIIKGKTIES